MSTGRLTAARRYLGLNRNVAVLALSIFGQGLGEELWQSYLPKSLTALGASGVAVGLFSSLKDVLDGLYQYPGGWAGDRFGRKRALTLFYVSGGEGFISIFTQLGAGKYQPVAKIPTAARALRSLFPRSDDSIRPFLFAVTSRRKRVCTRLNNWILISERRRPDETGYLFFRRDVSARRRGAGSNHNNQL